LLLSTFYYYIRLLISRLGYSQNQAESNGNFLNFENSTLGIKLQYPDSWTSNQYKSMMLPTNGSNRANGISSNTSQSHIVNFTAQLPLASKNTKSAEANMSSPSRPIAFFEVNVTNNVNNQTLEGLTKAIMSISNLTTGQDYGNKIINHSYINFSNIPSHEFIFMKRAPSGTQLNSVEIFTLLNGKIYDIRFGSDTQRFSSYLPLFQHMINTFEFTEINSSSISQQQQQTQPTQQMQQQPQGPLVQPNLSPPETNGINQYQTPQQQTPSSLSSQQQQYAIPSPMQQQSQFPCTTNITGFTCFKPQYPPPRVITQYSYIDQIGYFHIVGEVENDVPVTAKLVQVKATLYNAYGQSIGTALDITDPMDMVYTKEQILIL
jgi:hypothetical protein